MVQPSVERRRGQQVTSYTQMCTVTVTVTVTMTVTVTVTVFMSASELSFPS
jgi:hypothetical protein